MATQTLRIPHHQPAAVLRTALPAAFVASWASGYVAGAIALRDAPPLAMLAIRFALAALVLLAIAVATRAPWPRDWRTAAHLVVAGLLTQAVQFGFAYTGVAQGVSPALAALIVGLMPVLVGVFSGPVLGERLGRSQWIGLALGFAGVLFVVGEQLRASHLFAMHAIALVVVGLLGITAGMLYQKRFVAEMDLRSGGFIQTATAAIVLGTLALFAERGHVGLVPQFVLAMGWLVIVNSLGGLTLMYVLIRTGAASRAASTFYLIPPVAAAMSAVVLHERFSLFILLGFALASCGVHLASRLR